MQSAEAVEIKNKLSNGSEYLLLLLLRDEKPV
jgi:hypothetical protein